MFVSIKKDLNTTDISYYLYVDGSMYIIEKQAYNSGVLSKTFFRGNGAYATSWSSRTSLTYDYDINENLINTFDVSPVFGGAVNCFDENAVKTGSIVNVADFPLLWINGLYYDTFKDNTFVPSGSGCVFAGDAIDYAVVTEIDLNNQSLTTDFDFLDKFVNLEVLSLNDNLINTINLQSNSKLIEVDLSNNQLDILQHNQIYIGLNNNGLSNGFFISSLIGGGDMSEDAINAYISLKNKDWVLKGLRGDYIGEIKIANVNLLNSWLSLDGSTLNIKDKPLLWIREYINNYQANTFNLLGTSKVGTNVWQQTENLDSNRYATSVAITKQPELFYHNGIKLQRLTGTNFYSALRSQVQGLGITQYITGERYLISYYIKSTKEQFLWMRTIASGSSFGHGARFIDTNVKRVWAVVEATSASNVAAISTPTIELGVEPWGDTYWLVQASTEGNSFDVFVGGFMIEKLSSNTYKDGVALIGDSTMAGASGGKDLVNTNAREVSTWIGGLLNINVFNRAVGGERLDTMDSRWAADITPIAINCKYAIIQGGINDLAQSRSLIDMKASMSSMVSKAIADGLIPVVFTCSPATSIVSLGREVDRVAFNDWIKATFENVCDIAKILEDPLNSSVLNPLWEGDGVHYAQLGKRTAGEFVANLNFWDFEKPTRYEYATTTPTVGTTLTYDDKQWGGDAIDYSNIEYLNLNGRGLTTDFNTDLLGDFFNLTTLNLNDNLITVLDVSNNLKLNHLRCKNNQLDNIVISQILIDFDTNGTLNGYFESSIFGGGTLTAAGLIAKANLEAKDWEIVVL